MSLFSELKRRNVFRVGAAYIIVAWLIMQVGDIFAPALRLPEWATSLLAFFLVLGFPLALFFAWAFELTPDGLKKEKDVDRSQSIAHKTGRRLNFLIIGLLSVAVIALVTERFWPSGDDVAEKSVAVLPLHDLSPSQDHAYFADGLAEEILNALARTPDLQVKSRTSSFAFRDARTAAEDIARELRVAYILEGSVRRSADRLRVTAQLFRASDGSNAWSENYDRPVDDLIAVQEDIATQIANAMQTAMDPEALARMVSAGTNSVPAFEAYLEGIAANARARATGFRQQFLGALEALERAVELDPEFALAHRELALFWRGQLATSMLSSGLTDHSGEELRSKYATSIDSAIEHEKDPVSRLGYQAYKARYDFKLYEALRYNTEYLEQRPNDPSAQRLRLSTLRGLGRDEEAVNAALEFWERDGNDASLVGYSIELLRYYADPATQRDFVAKAIERFSNHSDVLYQAHRNMLWIGDIKAARNIMSRLYSTDWSEIREYLTELRQACAEGRREDAARLYDDGIARFSDRVSTLWLSHMIMRKEDDAVALLKQFDDLSFYDPITSFLNAYAFFDPRPYEKLTAFLEQRGIPIQDPQDIPYRCGAATAA